MSEFMQGEIAGAVIATVVVGLIMSIEIGKLKFKIQNLEVLNRYLKSKQPKD